MSSRMPSRLPLEEHAAIVVRCPYCKIQLGAYLVVDGTPTDALQERYTSHMEYDPWPCTKRVKDDNDE